MVDLSADDANPPATPSRSQQLAGVASSALSPHLEPLAARARLRQGREFGEHQAGLRRRLEVFLRLAPPPAS